MTQGETLFYLREIHSHWCTSNVSRDKLAELAAAKLIEIHGTPVVAVRLTSEGVKIKTSSRPSAENGKGISPKERNFRHRRTKKTLALPRSLE